MLFVPFYTLVFPLLGYRLEPVQAVQVGILTEIFGFLSSTSAFWRRGLIDFRVAGFALIFAVPTAILGGYLANRIPGGWLLIAVGLTLMVFSFLLLPWEVFSDEKTCTRDQVEAVCSRFGVDPEQSGWIAPRPRGVVVYDTTTPELVHGVAVGNPSVAKVLKDMGWFSGKSKQPAYPAEKPSH